MSKLFIKDTAGAYLPASEDDVLLEAKQYARNKLKPGNPITSVEFAMEAIRLELHHHESEVFAALFLDSSHRVLAWKELFYGSLACTTVHPREVVKEALHLNAGAVILAHTHPSGNSTPSSDDIDIAGKLQAILKVVDVRVLDHLIIGEEVVSLRNSGYMSA